jgi:hypothetical protein
MISNFYKLIFFLNYNHQNYLKNQNTHTITVSAAANQGWFFQAAEGWFWGHTGRGRTHVWAYGDGYNDMSVDTNWGCPTKQHLLLVQGKKKDWRNSVNLYSPPVSYIRLVLLFFNKYKTEPNRSIQFFFFFFHSIWFKSF